MESIPTEPPAGILFDFDGTLLDSMHTCHIGICHVCSRLGGRLPTLDYVLKYFHPPFVDAYRILGVTADLKRIAAVYFEVVDHRNDYLFADVIPNLSELFLRDVRTGIISANTDTIIRHHCNSNGRQLGELLHYAKGSSAKKAIDIRFFCKEHYLSPGDVWVVGDARSDVRAAREAGCVAVGITRGNPTESVLMESGAHFCVRDLNDLSAFISQIG